MGAENHNAEDDDGAALDFLTPIVADGHARGQSAQQAQEQHHQEGCRNDGDETDVFAPNSGGDPLFESPQRQPQQTGQDLCN